MNQDTICAIATAQGGAIGNIRVSRSRKPFLSLAVSSNLQKPANYLMIKSHTR